MRTYTNYPDPPGENRWQRAANWKPRGSVVRNIIIINIAVFILQLLTADTQGYGSWMTGLFGLSRAGLANGYIWQIFTYAFLHAGLFHILANMLLIYFAGMRVEAMLGPKNFLFIYFMGAALGGAGQLLMSSNPLVGASAAGFAILLVLTTMHPEMEITLLLFFILPIRLKAKFLGYGSLLISLLFVLVRPNDNIGHMAHLVGGITGWAYARYLGFGNPTFFESWKSHRQEQAVREQNKSPEEYISEEIDPILDKISKHGIHSLTRQERAILEKGREKIARRTSIR